MITTEDPSLAGKCRKAIKIVTELILIQEMKSLILPPLKSITLLNDTFIFFTSFWILFIKVALLLISLNY